MEADIPRTASRGLAAFGWEKRMETMTALSPAEMQALLLAGTSLNFTVSWDYNHQNLRQMLSKYAPGVEMGIWWTQGDGFVSLSEHAEALFGEIVEELRGESLQLDTSLRALPRIERGWVQGIVANRQTFGLLFCTASTDELAHALMQVVLPQIGLARLAWALGEEVARRTSTDKATGLWNRQYFNERFREECERVVRSKETGTVAIVGLDNFVALAKTMPADEINAMHAAIGQAVRQVVRQTDWAVRWDGEEILLYFPSTTAESVLEVLKRFAKRLTSQHAILEPLVGLSSTLETTSPRALIQLATRRLELARKDGGRRVICYATPARGLQFLRGDGN
jgi:diguanylate cyclase (GGDEF)-like protein